MEIKNVKERVSDGTTIALLDWKLTRALDAPTASPARGNLNFVLLGNALQHFPFKMQQSYHCSTREYCYQ